MMAHLIAPATASSPVLPARSKLHSSPPSAFHHGGSAHQAPQVAVIQRRRVAFGVAAGVLLGLNLVGKRANAAGRRPPPPQSSEQEKKDPNVSGVLAKVLASKKRKEAMKESMAKLREKGKPVDEPPPPSK